MHFPGISDSLSITDITRPEGHVRDVEEWQHMLRRQVRAGDIETEHPNHKRKGPYGA